MKSIFNNNSLSIFKQNTISYHPNIYTYFDLKNLDRKKMEILSQIKDIESDLNRLKKYLYITGIPTSILFMIDIPLVNFWGICFACNSFASLAVMYAYNQEKLKLEQETIDIDLEIQIRQLK